MNIKNFKKTVQSGFTLVELIIVIVIVGILAAVAIPKLTDTSKSAYLGVETATLGALKSAWSAAYAKNQGVLPTAAQVADQMSEPFCDALVVTEIKCYAGKTNAAPILTKDGSTPSLFLIALTTGKIASPSDITAQ